MLANIIDHRTNSYAKKASFVVEPAAHDNSIPGAAKYDNDCEFVCDSLQCETLEEAVKIVSEMKGNVTLFIYDHGAIDF